jgi:hypothetical protein
VHTACRDNDGLIKVKTKHLIEIGPARPASARTTGALNRASEPRMCQRQDRDQRGQLRFSHAWSPDSDSAKQLAAISANRRYQMRSAAPTWSGDATQAALATLHRGAATSRAFLPLLVSRRAREPYWFLVESCVRGTEVQDPWVQYFLGTASRSQRTP